MTIEIILVSLLVILAYAWVGYPALLICVAGRARGKNFAADCERTEGGKQIDISCRTPWLALRSAATAGRSGVGCESGIEAAILLAAYNEEASILARLENIVECGETGKRQEVSGRNAGVYGLPFSIHLGIDACTDRTAEIAKQFAEAHSNIHVHEFKQRRGKIAVLKDLVKSVEGGKWKVDGGRQKTEDRGQRTADGEVGVEGRAVNVESEKASCHVPRSTSYVPQSFPSHILIFTDANTTFRPDALAKMLAHFDDREVGGVCGRLVFVGEEDEGVYWRWETRLKEAESRLDSCLGANGAIYAIRADLFPRDLPVNTIVDDFVIGMKVREQGFRMVYEPDAVAEEDLPETASEWARRVRIGAGDFQALTLCWRCLLPSYGIFAWTFWSHKVLRWLTPHMMLATVAVSVAGVLRSPLGCSVWILSIAVLSATALFSVCAALGRVVRRKSEGEDLAPRSVGVGTQRRKDAKNETGDRKREKQPQMNADGRGWEDGKRGEREETFNLPACQPRTAWGRLAPDRLRSGGQAGIQRSTFKRSERVSSLLSSGCATIS